MPKKTDRLLLLSEEQTILSRERTMHAYMQTGLAFISVGVIILQVIQGSSYMMLGGFLILVGFLQLAEAFRRYMKYRHDIRELRRKEKRYGIEIWK